MKRQYEIVYIFDSALEEPEVNEHLDRFHDLLKSPDNSEPITGIAHWGKRTLAYPIKNKETGYYVVAHFEADTGLLSEFERIIKLDDAVLRYLVVINEGLSVHRPEDMDSPQDEDDDEDSDLDSDDDSDEPKPKTDAVPDSEPDNERAPATDGGGE